MPAAEAGGFLRPKILLNLGITLEAAGNLQQACKSYRCVVLPLDEENGFLGSREGQEVSMATDTWAK